MRYIYEPCPNKLGTLMAVFNAGSRVEYKSKYPNGIAHFMEHMRFKGTKTNSSKDLSKKCAQAGGEWNAWTSEDLVAYHMTIPEENIKTAFYCLSDVVFNPIFPANELKKEKEVVVQEVRMYLDDIHELINNRFIDLVFSNSLNIPTVGSEKSVRAISRNNLISFNKEHYGKNNLLLIYCGANDQKELVEKYFGNIDNIQNKDIVFPKTNYRLGDCAEVIKPKQLQDSILLSYADPNFPIKFKDRKASMDVFCRIFGRGETSRLFTKVREDLALVYGIWGHYCKKKDGSWFSIYTDTEPNNTPKVIKAINSEISKIKNTLPKKSELETAKNAIRRDIYSIISSDHIIYQTINRECFKEKVGEEYLEEVSKVKLSDVADIANDIFNSPKYLVIGTGETKETNLWDYFNG